MTTQQAAQAGYLVFDERQVTSKHNRSNPQVGDPCHTLHSDAPGVAYQCHGSNVGPMGSLRSAVRPTSNRVLVNGGRRLLPVECERLQGFPDGWTEGFSDSCRYRMLGNAIAVPVAEWIGKRIMEMA